MWSCIPCLCLITCNCMQFVYGRHLCCCPSWLCVFSSRAGCWSRQCFSKHEAWPLCTSSITERKKDQKVLLGMLVLVKQVLRTCIVYPDIVWAEGSQRLKHSSAMKGEYSDIQTVPVITSTEIQQGSLTISNSST